MDCHPATTALRFFGKGGLCHSFLQLTLYSLLGVCMFIQHTSATTVIWLRPFCARGRREVEGESLITSESVFMCYMASGWWNLFAQSPIGRKYMSTSDKGHEALLTLLQVELSHRLTTEGHQTNVFNDRDWILGYPGPSGVL